MSKDKMTDDMYVFSEEEMHEINEIRNNYTDLTEREKFIVKEALKPFFYGKKQS